MESKFIDLDFKYGAHTEEIRWLMDNFEIIRANDRKTW